MSISSMACQAYFAAVFTFIGAMAWEQNPSYGKAVSDKFDRDARQIVATAEGVYDRVTSVRVRRSAEDAGEALQGMGMIHRTLLLRVAKKLEEVQKKM